MRSKMAVIGVFALAFATLCRSATMASNQTLFFTTTAAEVDTIQNTPVTQNIFDYSVELRAGMQGGGTVYDQTFNVAFSDPQVQNAVAAAEAILQGDGAASFLGPDLINNSQLLLGTEMNTMQTGQMSTGTFSATTTYVGPQ